jgi:hypothetical protein
MSGTTTITQNAPGYTCQTEGNGVTLQLNSLDSIDTSGVADSATAFVETGATWWRWYQGDATAPNPGTVVQPITDPTSGRWKLIVASAALAYYQTIQNSPLNFSVSAPIYDPDQSPVQQPILKFINMQAVDSGGATCITAAYQQIVYNNDLLGAPSLVENPRARMRIEQLDILGTVPGQILQVLDDGVNNQTFIQFFRPAYQTVQTNFSSKNLQFAGPVTVTDDGGDNTTVTISAAVLAPTWSQVLAAGNTSAGLGAGNFPDVNHADTLYISDSAKMLVRNGGTIHFASASNQLIWDAGGTASIYYAGGGSDAGGAPLIMQAASHSGGNTFAAGYIHAANTNTGGLIRLAAGNGSAAASSGGAINMNAGNGTTDGGNFNVDTGAGAGGIGGFAVFTLGSGSTTGGGFQCVGGAGGVQGGGIEFTSGSGPTSGAIRFTVGAGGVASDFIVTGGLGATAGSELRFTAGATTAGAGGSIHHTGGDGTTAGGNSYFSGGNASAGPGGSFFISGGQGTDGGGFSFTGGTASVDKGGEFSVTGGTGINDGGAVLLRGGTITVPVGRIPGILTVHGVNVARDGYVELTTSLLFNGYAGKVPETFAGGGSLYSNNSGGKVKLFWKYSDGTIYQITP